MMTTSSLEMLKTDAGVRMSPKIAIICRNCTWDSRSKAAQVFKIMRTFVAARTRHLYYDFLQSKQVIRVISTQLHVSFVVCTLFF